MKTARPWIVIVALVAIVGGMVMPLAACPFCSAVQQTLSEEIKGADAALIIKLAKAPVRPETKEGKAEVNPQPTKATFEVVKALKGSELLGGKQTVEILYFGNHPAGTIFFCTGVDPKDIAWSTPTALSPRAAEYIGKIITLPETGATRLEFFQNYFEDEDPLLAGDAYDEFAKAPYADVQALKEKMHRSKLLGWINDAKTSTSRRRLYLTMLGVCGQAEDIVELEKMVQNTDRQLRTSLDALVACYLNLKGPAGLPLVEDLFLKNAKAEYVDTYATIMALRFHGQESNVIPKDRLLAALRHMLDRPQLADLVIPDLARWEDWSALDKLVELFKNAKDDSIWVRVPVINYLRACPKPEAKTAIEDLAKIDPDAVKRANQFFPFAAKPPASAVRPEDKKKDKTKETDAKESGSSSASGKLSALLKPAIPEVTPSDAPLAIREPKQAAASMPAESVVDSPRVSRVWMLIYAGLSATGLTVIMFSMLYTKSRSRRGR
ncbi:MAG: hypothetical protein JNM18_15235 [Planctomycetaceae bacterium]|nr:hypothetical protein [Planctomycetaceae bacterium]